FCAVHILLLTRSHTLKETDSPSPRNHQLPTVPQLGERAHETSPLHARMPTGLILCSHSCCVQGCNSPSQRHCFSAVLPSLWPLQTFSPLSLGGRVMQVFQVWLSLGGSVIQMFQVWLSLGGS
ncbi:hypothetical protein LEMLEM_LOCUS26648, partial [Lemmus lemmus]